VPILPAKAPSARHIFAIVSLLWLSPSLAGDPPTPLDSGTYLFQWRDAEFPNSAGFPVKVIIDGDRISVINEHQGGAAPLGELESAILMWNAKLSKWVLGHSESARSASEAGDCSGEGPHVIDFQARVIWTCEWGP
jgi:hypothetical protein